MIIDLIVAAVIIISAIISFLRGFIREFLTIIGMAGGLFAAYTFGDNLSPVFRNWLDVDPENPSKLFEMVPMTIVADGLAYAVIFITVVIAISVISHFTSSVIKATGLGPVDRTFGVIFGIVRAVLLLGIIYLPFHLLMDVNTKDKYFGSSITHTYIEDTSEFLSEFLPSSDEVEEQINAVDSDNIKQKLFENEFLKDKAKKTVTGNSEKPQEGYQEQSREDLDNLIEEEKDPLENRPVY